jgi:hypothetical protein
LRLLPHATPAPHLAEEVNRRDAETERHRAARGGRANEPPGRARCVPDRTGNHGDSRSLTAKAACSRTWAAPASGLVAEAFQAGHAGSIPVARSRARAQVTLVASGIIGQRLLIESGAACYAPATSAPSPEVAQGGFLDVTGHLIITSNMAIMNLSGALGNGSEPYRQMAE